MPSANPARPAQAASANPWLALDRQLCFALYAASLAVTKAYKPLLEPLGLTYPQYLVLLVLWEQDDQSVSALGERLTLDSGTLTPLLKRMESQGLLARSRDQADERRVRVRLTAAGQALQARALPVPQAMACTLACDVDEIQQLTTRLTRLRQQVRAATLSPGAAPDAAPNTGQDAGPGTGPDVARAATPAAAALPSPLAPTVSSTPAAG